MSIDPYQTLNSLPHCRHEKILLKEFLREQEKFKEESRNDTKRRLKIILGRFVHYPHPSTPQHTTHTHTWGHILSKNYPY